VKVEPHVDVSVASRNALPQAAIELRQSWRVFRM
jgi:hypothetical protein